jgi:DNA-binding SARP family transcriptional activator/tetratricopeptide (TPR) repeat protein
MAPALRIYLFGGFRLAMEGGDFPSIATVKARSLFAYLVLHAGVHHTRDLLAGQFWPELPNALARRRLSQALWRIRQVFDPDCAPLKSKKGIIRFAPEQPYWLDVTAFEQSLGQGDEAGLRKAIGYYQGDFMAGHYDDWLFTQRERLRDQFLDALESLLHLCKTEGKLDESLRLARRLALAEPLRETAHYEIMRLCHLLNRPQEALRQYQILQDILHNELGLKPSARSTYFYRQLRQEIRRSISAPVMGKAMNDVALVGREGQRRQLLARLDAATRGAGGLVLLDGGAGIGKTRLLQTIAQDARWRSMRVLWGWGEDRAQASSYHMLLQILHEALTPLWAEQLQPQIQSACLNALRVRLPHLQKLKNPPTSGLSALPPEKQCIHEALAQLILSLGRIQPHLLIFEDVHWADALTLEALQHLTPLLPQAQILIILSFRGGEARDDADLWALLQGLHTAGGQRMQLNPMPQNATAELVRLSLGMSRIAPQFSRRIYQHSRGNPLVVLELLRFLMDDNVLFRDDAGQWRMHWDASSADYGELPLPASVQQNIARRLQKLSGQERRFINAAAVLGARFDFSMLVALLRWEIPLCSQLVNALDARGFWEAGTDAYHFRHHLIHQAVLGEMDAAEQQQWHRQIFHLLEREQPQSIEKLAYHATAAHLADAAMTYNLQAGEQAQALYANTNALHYFEQALALVPTGQRARRWAVLRRIESVLDWLARREAQNVCLEEMMALSDSLQDKAMRAKTLFRYGKFKSRTGKPHACLHLLDEASSLAREVGDIKLEAFCHQTAARAYWHTGDVRNTLVFIQRAEALFQVVEDVVGEIETLQMKGNLYLGLLGHYESAMRSFERLRALAESLGDDEMFYTAQGNLAISLMSLGRYFQSLSLLSETIAFFEKTEDLLWLGVAYFCLGNNYLGLDRLEMARDAAERGLTFCAASKNTNFAIELHSLLGQIDLLEGAYVAAVAHFEKALAVALAGEQASDAAIQQSYLAVAQMHLGRLEEGMALSEQALAARTTEYENLPFAALMAFHHYQIALRAHGPEAAYPWLQRAHEKLMAAAGTITDSGLQASFLERVSVNRSIVLTFERWASGNQPVRVRLPRIDAPQGRPLRDDEWLTITWTPFGSDEDLFLDKVAYRRAMLLSMLDEAAEQGAAPRVKDLAQVLSVSTKTIHRDLAFLRAHGHPVRTRGARVR